MNLVFTTCSAGECYRDVDIDELVLLKNELSELAIDGVLRAIAKFHSAWWIIPSDPQDDDVVEKIGPFESAELAVTTIRLLA